MHLSTPALLPFLLSLSLPLPTLTHPSGETYAALAKRCQTNSESGPTGTQCWSTGCGILNECGGINGGGSGGSQNNNFNGGGDVGSDIPVPSNSTGAATDGVGEATINNFNGGGGVSGNPADTGDGSGGTGGSTITNNNNGGGTHNNNNGIPAQNTHNNNNNGPVPMTNDNDNF